MQWNKKGKKQLYKKSQSIHYDKCVLINIIISYHKTQNTVSLTDNLKKKCLKRLLVYIIPKHNTVNLTVFTKKII